MCQDSLYAEHLRKYYHIRHAFQLPPGGNERGLADNTNREYDVVFIGTYEKPLLDAKWTQLERDFYDYILSHRELTFEKGLAQFLRLEEEQTYTKEFLQKLWTLVPVCRSVIRRNREQIIETRSF